MKFASGLFAGAAELQHQVAPARGLLEVELRRGGEHPFLREMVCIFPATALATVAFLALGTALFADKPEEREEVEAFFRRMDAPSEAS